MSKAKDKELEVKEVEETEVEEVEEVEEKSSKKDVEVRFEGGQTRVYTGKDAMAKAKEFCGKREGREIVK